MTSKEFKLAIWASGNGSTSEPVLQTPSLVDSDYDLVEEAKRAAIAKYSH